MADLTVLITGATNGHGLALARSLAADGATVIVHGRSAEKAAAAGVGETVAADLGDLRAVEELGAEVRRRFGTLDVLVNNAGIGSGPRGQGRQVSADGIELRFAVNYLAGVVLTAAVRPGRVVNIASLGQAPLDPADPLLERSYGGSRAYAQSKLAQIMWTFDLAASGVTANAIHPGTYMPTGMVAEAGVTPLTALEDGVAATARLVKLEGISGKFFDGQREATADPTAYDPKAREYLRALTDKLLADALPARA
ncbi:SDR family NAD(P)-dependent oxidoreductase [Cryptosporangium phraense]|uniref:SDR family NAD(P)-dependent oxidoreductase n=1 Tax=Cryptosporangium phraense TaxID=2593070 RepID=A0A545AKI6_9ACTN|nr:SDR family NAD(P)-dependent oxidoreductase [Cryptosporangium phraense]TQS41770.1 SDR family NAD(P)-dependent oxidoreductase [Cryptosporangium phraense]